MSFHESGSENSISETSTPRPPQSVMVQTSEVPPWARLLTAPACCVLLGLLLSPKFLVLAVVYGLTSVRPLYFCYRQSRAPLKSSNHEDQKVRQQLDAALSLHRSLTLQFAMLASCLWLYEHSRLLCMPKNNIDDGADSSTLVVHQAFDMAKRLVHWERALGLAIEPALQGFVLAHCHWVIAIANTYYAILHFVAPFGVMARLIVYNKDPRYEYRAGFFVMLFFALLLFTFVPTMPPRLMPSYHAEYIETQQVTISAEDAQVLEPYWHIVDTMKQGETLYDKLHKEGGNPYAAMPSMHTGWALWSCLTWIGTLDSSSTNEQSRRLQTTLAISHVVFMVFVIIVTGNHFWMDAAAGAICVLMGRFLARRLVQAVAHCSEGNGIVGQLVRRWQLLAGPTITKCDVDKEDDCGLGLTVALTTSPSGSLSRSSSSGSTQFADV
jgi:hypothetical protein